MKRAIAALGVGAVALAAGLAWWARPRGADLAGIVLDVDADPGRAAADGGPVVAEYGPEDTAILTASLCPPDGRSIDGEIHAAAWAASGRGEWRLIEQDWPWNPAEAGCLVAVIEAPAAEWWPDSPKGVVRWAVVVGEGAGAPLVEGGPSWRERGLLVVDGEAIRTP